MTRKQLSQLKYLNKEIDLLVEQINDTERLARECTTVDIVRGSERYFPYRQRHFRIEGIQVDLYERRLNRLKNKLQRRLSEAMDLREELEEYIDTVPDSLVRQILSLRYINGLNWNQVAAHVGGGNTADGVRMIHNRFLSKNNRNDN